MTGRQALSVARDWNRFLHRNHYKLKEHYVVMLDARKMNDYYFKTMALSLIRAMREDKKHVIEFHSMRPFRKEILGYILHHKGDRLIDKEEINIIDLGE